MTLKMNLLSTSMTKQILQYTALHATTYIKYCNYAEVLYQEKTICSKRLQGVEETATFFLIKVFLKLFDLSSDDSLRESIKKEFLRFYEVHGESTIIKISSEKTSEKFSNGRTIGGTFKSAKVFNGLSSKLTQSKYMH